MGISWYGVQLAYNEYHYSQLRELEQCRCFYDLCVTWPEYCSYNFSHNSWRLMMVDKVFWFLCEVIGIKCFYKSNLKLTIFPDLCADMVGLSQVIEQWYVLLKCYKFQQFLFLTIFVSIGRIVSVVVLVSNVLHCTDCKCSSSLASAHTWYCATYISRLFPCHVL